MYHNSCSIINQFWLGFGFFLFYRTVQFDLTFSALLPAAAAEALLGLGQIPVVPLSFSLTLKIWAPSGCLKSLKERPEAWAQANDEVCS